MAGAIALKHVNSKLGEQPTFVYDETGKITGYKTKVGADTVFPFSGVMKFNIKGTFAAKDNNFNPIIAFTNNSNKTVTLNKISTTNTIEYIIVKDGTESTIMSALSTPTDVIDISNSKEVSVRITSPSSWQNIDIEVVVE